MFSSLKEQEFSESSMAVQTYNKKNYVKVFSVAISLFIIVAGSYYR